MSAAAWSTLLGLVSGFAICSCEAVRPSGDIERVTVASQRGQNEAKRAVPLVKVVPAAGAPSLQGNTGSQVQPPPPAGEPGETPVGPVVGATPVLAVKRFTITNEIRDREPVVATELAVGAPVVAFLELANASGTDLHVRIVFQHESGKSSSVIELPVPARKPRWRTWARSESVDASGSWTAVVTQKDGPELDRRTFIVP